jgi:anti-sigma factor RsiW
MRCAEYSEWMSLYLDGLLSQDEALQLQRHVSVCGACRQEWEAMCELSAALQADPVALPASDFVARVTLRLEQRVARQRRLYSGIGLCIGSVGLWISAGLSLLLLFVALWQPLIRVAVLDVGLPLLRDTLSLLATLGRALWSGVYAISTRPTWLLFFSYALFALGLAILWTRVVLRGWRHALVRSRI